MKRKQVSNKKDQCDDIGMFTNRENKTEFFFKL